MSTSQQLADQDRLERQALSRLAQQEAEREEAEAEEKAARDRAAWQAELARLAKADQEIVPQLAAELHPRSERCLEIARRVLPGLAEFCAAAGELETTETALRINRWPGMDDSTHFKRVASLRDRAGLKPRGIIGLHGADDDATRTALVALAAIARGMIGPRAISLSRESARIETSEGV